MRAFAAVPVPEPVAMALAEAARGFGIHGLKVARPGDMHITLKFFENIERASLDVYSDALEKALRGFGAFDAQISGAGAFPYVLWAGVSSEGQALERLAGIAGQLADGLGLPRDRNQFLPHITAGRLRRGDRTDLALELRRINAGRLSAKFRVSEIRIIQSVLLPEGPEYKCLRSICI